MEKTLQKLRKCLPLLAFIAAALWLFYQLYPIVFATHDDLRNYTLAQRGVLAEDALGSAKCGRISHLWNHFLLGFPFLLNKVWFYKLVSYGTLLFDFFAMHLLLKKHVSRRFADLSAVLGMAWLCINGSHNLLIAYALCHQIPIGFLFLSLYFFGSRMRGGKVRNTVFSCIFLLAACMIYEAFTVSLLLFAVWALAVTPQEKGHGYFSYLWKAAGKILPQVCTAGAYMIVYFAWQHFYPPTYDGTALVIGEPFVSLYAAGVYGTSMFPLAEMMRLAKQEPVTAMRFFGHLLHPAPWICAFLTAAAFYSLLPQIRLPKLRAHITALLSGLGILVPCVLIGCSEKYIKWIRRGTTGYLPSFYSYLFLVTFLTVMTVRLYRSATGKPQRQTIRIVTTLLVCGLSLCASSLTDMWKPAYMQLVEKYYNFDRAVSSASFTDCDESWQLYAPDYEGIHRFDQYTEDYLQIHNPAQIEFINAEKDILPDKRILCMRTTAEHDYILAGETDAQFHADTVTAYSAVRDVFQVILKDTAGNDLVFEQVHDGDILNAPAGTLFDMNAGEKLAEEN